MDRLHDLGSSILILFYSKMNFFRINLIVYFANFSYENSNVNINFIDFDEKQDS